MTCWLTCIEGIGKKTNFNWREICTYWVIFSRKIDADVISAVNIADKHIQVILHIWDLNPLYGANAQVLKCQYTKTPLLNLSVVDWEIKGLVSKETVVLGQLLGQLVLPTKLIR